MTLLLKGAGRSGSRLIVPPQNLEILASVGTSTSPTSTGTKAVTGIGFQPKVVMPFGVINEATGSNTVAGLHFGGAISSSSEASVAICSANGVTTSATYRRHQNSRIITNITPLGATDYEAELSSLDSSGFTLNWTSVLASARILNHICLGGADLEVSLTQHQMNNDNSNQSFAHGLSGAPTGLLFFSTWDTIAPPNTSTQVIPSIGAWSSSFQFSASIYSLTNLTTTNTKRSLRNDCVASVSDSIGAFQRTMAVSSVDATNVNCTYPITIATGERYFWMLAIRGANCQTGTFDHDGSTSPLTISTTGITPKLFLPIYITTGVDSINTVLNGVFCSIGASDGTNNVSCGITDQNGATTTNARRFQSSNSLREYDSSANLINQSTASFSGESVIITPTTMTSGLYGQGAYLVIGS